MCACLALLGRTLCAAETPRIAVRPLGTNQLVLSLSSLQPNFLYLIMARTNAPQGHWVKLDRILGSTNAAIDIRYTLGSPKGLTIQNLSQWTFVIGSAEDSNQDELPDVYEDLVSRSDPYTSGNTNDDPDADGWSTLQEMQNGTDPLNWDAKSPDQSGFGVQYLANHQAKLSWGNWSVTMPEYFVIEKAQRTFEPEIPMPAFVRSGQPLDKTNLAEYRAWFYKSQRVDRARQRPGSDTVSAYQPIAQVRPVPSQNQYTFIDTNAAVAENEKPVYRVLSHYTPPLQAKLAYVSTASVSNTFLSVSSHLKNDGFELTVMRPIPYSHYLLLVRDEGNRQWRASGYFTSGTHRDQIQLHVDSMGMMHEGQAPITMPEVKFLPLLKSPEFAAGWGEDSDGDGLPDIFEVLVTQTDPAKADTGGVGVLDGYKDPDNDGWTNLEEFRRRSDPFKPNLAPPSIELKHPSLRDIVQATQPITDLRYEPRTAIRQAGEIKFKPLEQPVHMYFYAKNPRNPHEAQADFDLQIKWVLPEPRPEDRSGNHGP